MKDLAKSIIYLFESKGKHYTEATVDVWVNELKQYNPDLLSKAFRQLIDTKEAYITTGMIKDLMGESDDAKAVIEYDNMRKAILGSGGELNQFQKKALKEIGGSMRVKNVSSDYERNQLKKDFIKAFKGSSVKMLEEK